MKMKEIEIEAMNVFEGFEEDLLIPKEKSRVGFAYVPGEKLADKVLNFIKEEPNKDLSFRVQRIWQDSLAGMFN